jgi:hypothetical protein
MSELGLDRDGHITHKDQLAKEIGDAKQGIGRSENAIFGIDVEALDHLKGIFSVLNADGGTVKVLTRP